MRKTEERDGTFVRNCRTLRPGNELIEQRQGVASGSATRANDEGQNTGVHGNALEATHLFDVFEHRRRWNEPERVVVGARPDGADNLLGLCRGKDELDVLRRFFDQFEESVEALRGHHVGLVENENLEAVPRRSKGRAFTQVAGIIHTVVAGRVNLDDVEAARPVASQLDARGTLSARRIGGTLGAVQAAGQDARRRGLATAARTAKEIRVVDAIGAQGRHEGVGDLRLPNHFGKRLGPVAAVESGGHFSIVERVPDKPADIKGTPRAPARARLPLLRFRPGGVGLDGATRGADSSLEHVNHGQPAAAEDTKDSRRKTDAPEVIRGHQ